MNTMHLFNRALANAGPLTDQQRKAIFAKGGGGRPGGGGSVARDQNTGGSGVRFIGWAGQGEANGLPSEDFIRQAERLGYGRSNFGPGWEDTPLGKRLKSLIGPVAGTTPQRGGSGDNFGVPPPGSVTPQPGMSLKPTVPGMMYPAVQPPAGTHWEYDPNGGRHPVRDGMVTPGVQPRDPGQMYVGGNPNFDERTGQYRDPNQRVGGPAPVRGQPNAPITAPKQKPITAVGSNPGSVGGRVGVPAPLPGGGDQRVVPGRGFPGGPPLLPTVGSAPGQTWAVGQPGRPLVRGPGGAVSDMEWTQTQGPLGYSRMKTGPLSPNANDAEKARYADIQQGRVGQMTSGGYFMADGSGFVAAPSRTQQRAASLADLLKRARGS